MHMFQVFVVAYDKKGNKVYAEWFHIQGSDVTYYENLITSAIHRAGFPGSTWFIERAANLGRYVYNESPPNLNALVMMATLAEKHGLITIAHIAKYYNYNQKVIEPLMQKYLGYVETYGDLKIDTSKVCVVYFGDRVYFFER